MEAVETLNIVVGTVFTFEMLLGVIALGFWFESPRTYLRSDGANIFDFLIIVTMWVLYLLPDDVVPGHVASAVVAMRAFHVLKYFEGVKEIIGSILHGSQALWLVGELMILSFVIFATLGRELFGGSSTITWCGIRFHFSSTFPPTRFGLIVLIANHPAAALRGTEPTGRNCSPLRAPCAR